MTPSWSPYIFSPKNLGKFFRSRNLIIMVFGFPQSDQKVLQNLLLYFLFFLKAIRFRTLHSRLTFTEKKIVDELFNKPRIGRIVNLNLYQIKQDIGNAIGHYFIILNDLFANIYIYVPHFHSSIYFALRKPSYVDYSFLYLRLTGRGQQAKPEALPFDSQNRCLWIFCSCLFFDPDCFVNKLTFAKSFDRNGID